MEVKEEDVKWVNGLSVVALMDIYMELKTFFVLFVFIYANFCYQPFELIQHSDVLLATLFSHVNDTATKLTIGCVVAVFYEKYSDKPRKKLFAFRHVFLLQKSIPH